MEDVLCILTDEAIVILGMKDILESEDRNGKGPVSSPPVRRFIKFEEAGLPIAMGCLKLGNTLYMFGGETLTGDSYICGVTFGLGKLGYAVMTLDLCDPLSKPTIVGKLKGPKIVPVVFEFKSKIYVFSGEIQVGKDNFEVWDPLTRKASSLPSPPLQIFSIDGYFLAEREIVLATKDDRLIFNIDSQSWVICPKYVPRNLQDALRFRGVQVPGYDDVYLDLVGEGILSVNLLEPGLYQTFHWAKMYMDLNAEYWIRADMSHIADSREQCQGLGPRYSCVLVPCIDYLQQKMRIIIHVFTVHKNASFSLDESKLKGLSKVRVKELFSVTSLKKQVYEFNFHKIRGQHILPYVHHAFIWSLPQVSATSKESTEGANDRNAQDSRKA